MIISSPLLKEGNTYTIKIDDATYTTFTVNNLTTTVGNRTGSYPGSPRR